MHSGKVKWFNNAKGFGFIVSPDFEEDLFAHFSTIQADGFKSLKAGQSVNFEISEVDSGIHAINIQPVE